MKISLIVIVTSLALLPALAVAQQSSVPQSQSPQDATQRSAEPAAAPQADSTASQTAPGASSTTEQQAANYPASGGAAGANRTKVITQTALAGVGAAAVIGVAFAVADGGSDNNDENVPTGATGTTGTTGTR